MNRKLIFPVAFMVLVSLALFVSAGTMTREGLGPYDVEIELEEGWNLIAGIFPEEAIASNSEIKITDLRVVWSYVPKLVQYYQVYPVNEFDELPVSVASQIDEDEVLTNGMWVYSEKAGMLRYNTLEDYLQLSERQLYSGWNFVTVTPDLVEIDFENLKGSCNVERFYWWDNIRQDWLMLTLTDDLEPQMIGTSALIKVSDDCKLGDSTGDTGNVISPPAIPSNGRSSVSQLRTDIEGYYYAEFSFEDCDLNNYQNYNSQEDCFAAWACLASEFKELVAEEDLQTVADDMAANGGEGGYIRYVEQNPSVQTQLESKYDLCLGGRHEAY